MKAFFSRRSPAVRYRFMVISVVTVALIFAGLGFFFFPRESAEQAPLASGPGATTAADFGISFLRITPRLADYYGLSVSSGALVTEVVPGSPADRTGVQVGDVILSYNGIRLEEEVRLLEMMLACPAGNPVTLEIWGGQNIRTVKLFHAVK